MTDTTSTDVAVIENDAEVSRQFNIADAIQGLAEGRVSVYSTLQGDDFETKLELLDAVTNSEPIAENLNKPIRLVNVVIQTIEMADEKTAELREVPRVILLDESGTAYHGISMGLFRAVETILGVVGQPKNWPSPLNITVKREGTGTRQYFTIRPVKAKK